MSENLSVPEDIYQCLGVLKDSSSQEIHKRFLKLVRTILLEIKNQASGSGEQSLANLRRLWFAHDILMDPFTRTDYDLRALGIKAGKIDDDDSDNIQTINLHSSSRNGLPNRSGSWRIGELMQAAGLLEQTELNIACDMHKAVPEMPFGRFLTKQGFIDQKQLKAVLIGQILLRKGEITLSQFCSVMHTVKQSGHEIKEILLELGYIKEPFLIELEP